MTPAAIAGGELRTNSIHARAIGRLSGRIDDGEAGG
jgi:hypothetical protein